MKRSHRLFKKLSTLTFADRYALGKAVLRLAGARFGLYVFPFRVVRRFYARAIWRLPKIANPEEYRKRELWALEAAGLRILGRNPCLAQALVAERMLRSSGLSPKLCIGVTKGPDAEFLAHAWVECNGEIVMGKYEQDLCFVPLRLVGGAATNSESSKDIGPQAQVLSVGRSAAIGHSIVTVEGNPHDSPVMEDHDIARNPARSIA